MPKARPRKPRKPRNPRKPRKPRKPPSGKSGRCWSGYKPTPGKKPYSKGSCMKD